MKNKIIFFGLFAFVLSEISAQTPRLVIPIGHTNGVEAVAFSPDGKHVLTGSSDNTAKLWDLKGHEVQTFTGHTKKISSVAFSPDGKQVLTGSADSTAMLWDLYGKVIRKFTGHKDLIESVAFSPDGKQMLTGSRDKTAKLWSLDGTVIQTFRGHEKDVNKVAFSPDGKMIATASNDSTAKTWTLDGQVVQTFIGHDGKVKWVGFSPDGKQVLTGSDDKTAKLWSLDGKVIQSFKGHTDQVNMAVFSPDGSMVLTGSHDLKAKLWSLDGKAIRTFDGPSLIPSRTTVTFSPDGKQLVTGYKDGTVRLWDLDGSLVQIFRGHSTSVSALASSPEGKYLLAGNVDGTVKLWNLSGQDVQNCLGHTDMVNSVAFSIDGKQLLTGSKDYTSKLWDLKGHKLQDFESPDAITSVAFSPSIGSGQALTGGGMEAKLWNLDGTEGATFTDGESLIYSVTFSPNGKQVLTGGETEVKLWNADGQFIRAFSGHSDLITSVAFSPDGKQVLSGSVDKTARLWNLDGQVVQTFSGHGKGISSVAFSPDGKRVLTGSFDKTARLWDLNGRVVQTFTGHVQDIYSAVFSHDGKFVITGSFDNTVKIWDVATGTERATLMSVDSNDWVVTSPSGLFDASPGAMNLLHFVVGLEVIELEQLKERYYEPGLLSKIMGLNKEPMRSTAEFKDIPLYPEVKAELSADKTKLQVTLTPRNGGIGKLSLFINDKEVNEDANPQRASSVPLNLNDYAKYYLRDTLNKFTLNKLGLRAYNSAGWLKSQAYELVFTPPASGSSGNIEPDGPKRRKRPSLYAVIVGTSNYSGTNLDLKFADHDATSFCQALRVAAPRVFGKQVYITLLNTDDKDSTRQDVSSKANIKRAFEEIASKAQSQDVLLIYGSGHGINYGIGDNSQFYYLTKDIASDNLSNPEILQNYAISSGEFTEWIKSIAALKQVLILDACHSGKLVTDLSVGRKDLGSSNQSSNQVRALDRMKDRTGMYILTGSAADMVSYEASEYGQGLLTYTLLIGMRGRALDGKNVDIMRLFQFSRDEVPELAKSVGGIQTPVLATPTNGESFDIGIVEEPEKIPVDDAKKPMFIRSNFNDQDYIDVLDLNAELANYLDNITSKGAKAELIYTKRDDYPGAYSMAGLYTINGDDVEVNVHLVREKENKGGFKVTGKKDNVPALAEAIVKQAIALIQ